MLTDRERALPALRDAYAKATAPSAKLVYAHVLGILGDATGAETLARQIDGRDPEIRLNPKGLPAFGRRMSERDSFIVALGRTKSPLAVKPLLAELAKIDQRSPVAHVRALTLACEQVADPALAPALAAALQKDGVGGWSRKGAAAVTPAGGFGSSPETGRCLRELNLARALLACGDHEGLARKTLEKYGVFRHKCGSVQVFEVPNLVRRCYAYAEFGEIRSGYDARAVDCAMASQGLEICARATPESDFAKVFSEGHMRQSSTESTVA